MRNPVMHRKHYSSHTSSGDRTAEADVAHSPAKETAQPPPQRKLGLHNPQAEAFKTDDLKAERGYSGDRFQASEPRTGSSSQKARAKRSQGRENQGRENSSRPRPAQCAKEGPKTWDPAACSFSACMHPTSLGTRTESCVDFFGTSGWKEKRQ